MLPSEYPEVQATPNLKQLLAVQVDMQFVDLRTLLELPKADLQGGCNVTAAGVLFNVIAGSSVCFYQASANAFTQRGDRGARFVGLLREFYPLDGEELSKEEASDLLYAAARNPLAHTLGLDPPTGDGPPRVLTLRKWPLSADQVQELETAIQRPEWTRQTISEIERSGATITKASVSVPALYWGVHKMLREHCSAMEHRSKRQKQLLHSLAICGLSTILAVPLSSYFGEDVVSIVPGSDRSKTISMEVTPCRMRTIKASVFTIS
jgi:hypothetical protein